MPNSVVVAIDAMSGDFGPPVTVAAARQALQRHRDLQLILVGQPDVLREQVDGELPAGMSLTGASEVVAMDEAPASALRGKKDSSMRKALELVRDGEAHACVSAGNTGALVAKSRYLLKTIEGIDRPAIVSTIPARGGHACMLDLGANPDCTARQLLQFAFMGAGLVRGIFADDNPRVALLNIGEESIKGTVAIREADQLLRETMLNYIGYIEGDAILSGKADVIVTDGFTGNVALKTMEGVCSQVVQTINEEFSNGTLRRFLAALCSPALKSLQRRLDPRSHNGASLLGLRGSVVKSHGGADAFAFANAIDEAVLEARGGVPEKIARYLDQADTRQEAV